MNRAAIFASILAHVTVMSLPATGMEPYTSDWKSLRRHQVPQWAKDAKFGRLGEPNEIKSVELLGHGPVTWSRTTGALEITLPDTLPNDWALAFKITPEGSLDQSAPAGKSSMRKQRDTAR